MRKALFLAMLALLWAMPAQAATVTSTQADTGAPYFKPTGSGYLAVAHGVYEETSPHAAGDVWQMVKVPGGSCVVDGIVRADDIDTADETLDVNIGWEANGIENADSDGFGNLGIWTGDAVTDVKPDATIMYRFNGALKDGPVCFHDDTNIVLTSVSPAAGGGSGTLAVTVYYYVQ